MSKLRERREALELRREDLAARAEVSFDYVRKLETDPGANPTIAVARRIAGALDTTVDELFPAAQVETASEQA